MMFLRWLFRSKNYEIKIVIATLAVLIMLPILSVVVVVNSGFALVGEVLANLNPVTHLVEIFSPNGDKIAEVQLSTVWPTRGYVSDEFGTWEQWRKNLGLGPHSGIDIANSSGLSGEPVTPFIEGKVIKVNKVDDGDCGIYVKLRHEHNITSSYCHLSDVIDNNGQTVMPGDIIGHMGSTGESLGPHLHFQIAVYDIPVNPRTFMVGAPEGSTVKNAPPTL